MRAQSSSWPLQFDFESAFFLILGPPPEDQPLDLRRVAAVFVTSANFTDAAVDRNIEAEMLSPDRTLAASLAMHFRVLVEQELLLPLPSRRR